MGCATTAVRVSVRSDGSQSTMPASQPAVADDGRYVFFVSADPNMVPGDTNGVADVFVRDTCRGAAGDCTPSTTRVSVGPNYVEANGASGEPAFTGRFIAFTSAASNLVSDDTNGLADVFVRDLCRGATEPCSPSTERISVGVGGVQADGPSSNPVVSLPMAEMGGYDMHGRYVAFLSSATNLVAGDTNGVADAFQRDTCRWTPNCAATTYRVSLTSTGGQITGAPVTEIGFMGWDGGPIAFVTAADGLVPGDANGVADVFLWFVGSTTLVSDGTDGVFGNKRSYAPRLNNHPFGASAITFCSDATNLVPGSVPAPYYGSIFLNLPR
jgi:hypothetical protein